MTDRRIFVYDRMAGAPLPIHQMSERDKDLLASLMWVGYDAVSWRLDGRPVKVFEIDGKRTWIPLREVTEYHGDLGELLKSPTKQNMDETFRYYGFDFQQEVRNVMKHNASMSDTYLKQDIDRMITFDENNKDKAHIIARLFAAIAAGTYLEKFTGTEWLPYVGMWDEIAKNPMEFRVKPKPTYRPWKLGEIPVGAIARRTTRHADNEPRIAQVIQGADTVTWRGPDAEVAYAVMYFERDDKHTSTNVDTLMKLWEWKWAHEAETAWRTCGVAENT